MRTGSRVEVALVESNKVLAELTAYWTIYNGRSIQCGGELYRFSRSERDDCDV